MGEGARTEICADVADALEEYQFRALPVGLQPVVHLREQVFYDREKVDIAAIDLRIRVWALALFTRVNLTARMISNSELANSMMIHFGNRLQKYSYLPGYSPEQSPRTIQDILDLIAEHAEAPMERSNPIRIMVGNLVPNVRASDQLFYLARSGSSKELRSYEINYRFASLLAEFHTRVENGTWSGFPTLVMADKFADLQRRGKLDALRAYPDFRTSYTK